ncbi:MAG: hypothetical protein R3B47_15905 [Bacteroidia bacterium]
MQGTGTTGLGNIERKQPGYLSWDKIIQIHIAEGQPYLLHRQPAGVKLELWDLSGKVATILDEQKSSGSYNIDIEPARYGLSDANFYCGTSLRQAMPAAPSGCQR